MIASVEAFVRFRTASGRYRRALVELTSRIERDVASRLNALETTRDSLHARRQWLENDIEACREEEDDSHYRSQLEEVEAKLSELDSRLRDVEGEFASFKQIHRRVTELDRDLLRRMEFSAAEKQRLLEEYLAVTLGQFWQEGATQTSTLGGARGEATPTAFSGPGHDSSLALPVGFAWVNIDKLEARDKLQVDEQYLKASKAEMRKGFDRLAREVIPLVGANPNGGDDPYYRLDQDNGVAYPDGLLKIYESFFGDSSIAVELDTDANTYHVHNGRHRIAVAEELGWKLVPARVVNSKAQQEGA